MMKFRTMLKMTMMMMTVMVAAAFAPTLVHQRRCSTTRCTARNRFLFAINQPSQELPFSQLSSSSTPTPTSNHNTTTTLPSTTTGMGDTLIDATSPTWKEPKIFKTRCVTGVVPKAGPLNQAVAQVADVSLDQANKLIDIGAVWARMDALTETDLLEQYDSGTGMMSTGRGRYADIRRGHGKDEMDDDLDLYLEQVQQLRYRRILSPCRVEAGMDLRIYPEPRRFASCQDITKDSLLYEDTTFLIVDKPPMLPTQPDASNYHECCPGCVQEKLGPFQDIAGNAVIRPLICHRVDSCVGGCVVLSKDRNGQAVFQDLQRQRKIRKVYLAVTTQPVPIGRHLHWMWAPQSIRGKTGGPPCQLMSHTPPPSRRKARELWNRCVLEVVECKPIQISSGADGQNHDYDPADKQHYQSTIRLVTGRKHQVRAQLASLGCPIICDSLYEPMSGFTLDQLETSEGEMDQAIAQCRVPTKPIGLQAHAILFEGVRAKARTPWWGDQIITQTQ